MSLLNLKKKEKLWIAKIQFVQPRGKQLKCKKAKTVKVMACSRQHAVDKLSNRFPKVRGYAGIWHLISIRKYEDGKNANSY